MCASRKARAGGLAQSGVEQSPAWFGDCASEFLRRLDPLRCDHLDVRQRLARRSTIRRAAGELRYLGDEGVVVLTPVDDDLVLEFLGCCHSTTSSQFVFDEHVSYLSDLIGFGKTALPRL